MSGHRGKKWRVSHHACDMWIERVDDSVTSWQARHRIQRVMRTAIMVPNRLAGERWVRKWRKEGDAHFRKRGTRYYYSPSAILVIGSKSHVVTVLPTSVEDMATMLMWAITGLWLNEDV